MTGSALRTREPLAEALHLAKALVRHRALAIRRDWQGRSLYLFSLIFGSSVFMLIMLGTMAGARILEAAPAIALLRSIPVWAFLVYLFTDILIAFGQALGDLYLSRDMPILLTMPLRISSIVLAKFVLGVVQNEVYAAVFLLPFALGYLLGTGADWWTYPVTAAAVFIFPATLYAVLVVVTILALRIVPPKLAKEGLWLVGASVPTVFWFLSFYRVAHLSGDVTTMSLPAPPAWLPSTWVGNALAAFGAGQFGTAWAWIAVLALATFIVCPLALEFVAHSFSKGWSAGVAAPARKVTQSRTPPRQSSPGFALALKDLKTFLRSPQLWFNHIAALGFVVYLLVGHNVGTPVLPLTPQLAMVQVGFVAVLGSLNPGMTALSLEHMAIWVLKTAPLSTSAIVRAKFGIAFLQTGTIAAIGAAALCAGYGFSVVKTMAIVSYALIASASSVSVGIAFDAALPSFTWDNPNHINRGMRMLVPLLINIAVLLVCTAILYTMRYWLGATEWAGAAGIACSAVVYSVVITQALHLAARDVEALEV